jgi:hypothetical protein
MNVKSIAAVIGMSALVATGAIAQPRQAGLVNVEVSNVANDIARNVNVDVSQIPVTVQVPVGVAATVCGVAANVLGAQAASGNAQCTATSTNTALNNIVQSQLKRTNNS